MRCLFILGMHRSGTSLVAQSLNAAGIAPGPFSELLSAQRDNPEGFYENEALVGLNDALLADDGGSWYAPPSPESITARADTLTNDMQSLMAHLGVSADSPSSSNGDLFLKDPRLCLTWRSWLPLVSHSDVVFVYRSPLAVARSLARRNQFPLQFGLLLWEYYNRAALAALADANIRAQIVCYDLVASGQYDLQELVRHLGTWGYDCDAGKASLVFNQALDHSAQSQSLSDNDREDSLLTLSQIALHNHCMQLCLGEPHDSELEPFDEGLARHRLNDFGSALSPLATLYETRTDRDAALKLTAERTAERDAALTALAQLEGDYQALVAAHEEEQRLHVRAANTLQSLDRDHTELAAAHENEQRLHVKAGDALQALTRDHDRLAAAHEHEVSTHAYLRSAHEKLQGDFDERGSLQRQLYGSIDALQSEVDALVLEHRSLKVAHDALLLAHDALLLARAHLESERQALEDKTEYLFTVLTDSHRTLLSFELSTMAHLQRYTRKVYRLFTGQRGRNSAYEDLLEQANRHFDEFGIERPSPRPTKLRMATDVVRYVRQNPAGSARSFSWTRLRRAVSVFFGSSSDDLAVWVNARFPDAATSPRAFDPDSLSPDLDLLELDFPTVQSPLVSIVIPVYNDYRVTINCLQSVHRFSEDVDFEVIIADDFSTDLTVSIAERMRGVRVATTSENLRFLKNCNQAAAHARGQYIVFLNNDTAVTEGWLTALLVPFKDQQVGVTGPKLLFADGVLQEAGGIIWDDASGWNFGRADDRDKPAYNYRRDVDYVSGACLAIRSDLWRELGGFDERFAPAYYEDADICFSARAAGYRVVYQPESVIYHFEGVSNGTDLNAGVKQHQVVNQTVFRDKWQDELQARHFPNAQHVVHARDRSAGKPCILVIDHYVPHHDKDAGGRSTYMYIQLLLALGCRVQLMGANFFPHQPYTKALQAMGVEVLVGESIARHLDQWFAEHASYIDEIFLHRPHIAEQVLPHLERMSPRPPISFFGHDLHYLRIAREASLKDDDGLRRDSESWRKRELAVCERVDRVYYFSEVEIDALRERVPASKLRRIPLYTMQIDELPAYAPSAPAELLFVGGYNHPPNVDAALWVVNEILPRILEAVPNAKLHLVGSNPPTDVSVLASDVVQVHGYVSDEALDALYRKVGAVVVPLRYGAGIKGKIIEAIANHVPVVTTDIGVEGIPDSDSVMWIENTAQNIAERLIALLLEQESKDEKLDRHGAWLQSYFDRDSAADVLRADIPKLGYPKDIGQ